jgi:tetratricopeptide (TPR) repeat protein
MKMDSQPFLYFQLESKQGSSGGPIFNEKGEVIAVSTLGRSDVRGYSYGIPINAIKPLINHNELIKVNALRDKFGEAFRQTYFARGKSLEGKHLEAIALYQTALEADPDYLPATIGLARAYDALNKYKEAIQTWQQIAVRDSQNMEAHLYLGKTYLTRNELAKAIVHLELAAALAPQSSHTYNDLGIAYGKTKNYDKAIAMYQRSIDNDPLYATGYFNLSVAYYNKLNFLKAKEYCAQAIKLGYNVPQSYIMELGL